MRLPTRLLLRNRSASKKDFGHVFVIGGSLEMLGAAQLVSLAALRAGAGLVTMGVPESLSCSALKIRPKEVMLLPLADTGKARLVLSAFKKISEFSGNANCLVLGPGLGREKSTQSLVRKIVSSLNKPMVIDADGLNALVGHTQILKRSALRVLTPHPGEMSRLTGISVEKINKSRKKIALEFAERFNSVLVLKGKGSVVADPSGKLYVNKTGNPGMGTAGSGDVLSGIIAAFIGQGLSPFEAAKYGVYLHGLAGDLAAKEKSEISLIASDIIGKIPETVKRSI